MKVHLSLSYSLKIEDCFIQKIVHLCIWNTVIFIFSCGLKFHFGMDCITWSSLIGVLLFYASHAVNHLDYLEVQEAWISGPWVPSQFYKYAFLSWISFSFAFIEAVIRSTNLWDSEFNMPCSNLSSTWSLFNIISSCLKINFYTPFEEITNPDEVACNPRKGHFLRSTKKLLASQISNNFLKVTSIFERDFEIISSKSINRKTLVLRSVFGLSNIWNIKFFKCYKY